MATRFGDLAIGSRFMYRDEERLLGPFAKVSRDRATGPGNAEYYLPPELDVELIEYHSFAKEMTRLQCWEYLAAAWDDAEKGADGKWYALDRPSIWKCISRLWCENRLTYQDKEKMQKQLGPCSFCDEDLFGYGEEDAKNRVGFCIEQAIMEVSHAEILECDGHGNHYWKHDKGSRPAYGWVFEDRFREVCSWNMLCYNCGHVAMQYDFAPKSTYNGLLYRAKPSKTETSTVARKATSVYSSKTGLKFSAQGEGFVLK